jgi:hypothetical protein
MSGPPRGDGEAELRIAVARIAGTPYGCEHIARSQGRNTLFTPEFTSFAQKKRGPAFSPGLLDSSITFLTLVRQLAGFAHGMPAGGQRWLRRSDYGR